MKKTIFTVFATIAVVISSFVSSIAYADGREVSARSEFVVDYYTGTVVHEHNADEKLPIASMVKIMTSLIAFEKIDEGSLQLDQKVTISETASGMGGSQMFLESGDEYTVSDLLKGIIVVSANDASVQIAETIAGSETSFVELMNKRAKDLGMNDTRFVNATGLPAQNQYSTAKDVAKMLKALSSHPQYYDYSRIWIENYTHPDGRITEFVNTNKLVRFNKDCEGGKTGYTSEAKFCLATTARREETRLICVVIGSDSSKNRFARATSLLNSGFSRYVNSKILSKDVMLEQKVDVLGGKEDKISVAPAEDVYMFRERNAQADFEIVYELQGVVKAPLKKGDEIGVARVAISGEIREVPLIAVCDVEQMTYFDTLKHVLSAW